MRREREDRIVESSLRIADLKRAKEAMRQNYMILPEQLEMVNTIINERIREETVKVVDEYFALERENM